MHRAACGCIIVFFLIGSVLCDGCNEDRQPPPPSFAEQSSFVSSMHLPQLQSSEVLKHLTDGWRDYVDSVQMEVDSLASTAVTAEAHDDRGDRDGLRSVLLRRASRASKAMEMNAQLVGIIVRALESLDMADDRGLHSTDECCSRIGPKRSDDATNCCSSVSAPRVYSAGHLPRCNQHSASVHSISAYNSINDLWGHLSRDLSNSSVSAMIQRVYYGRIVRSFERWMNNSDDASGCAVTEHGCNRVVLVPGAGVGGLVLDIAHSIARHPRSSSRLNARVVGTECSPTFAAFLKYMLESSAHDVENFFSRELYPWAGSFSNVEHGDERDQFAAYSFNFPSRQFLADLKPKIEIVYADFFQSPHLPAGVGQVDAIVTCFVIDALGSIVMHSSVVNDRSGIRALNFTGVLRRIDELLAPGGLWINLGPLHFHHTQVLPKLSYDEVILFFTTTLGYTVVESPECVHDTDEPFIPYSRPADTYLHWEGHRAMFSVLSKPRSR